MAAKLLTAYDAGKLNATTEIRKVTSCNHAVAGVASVARCAPKEITTERIRAAHQGLWTWG